MHKLKATPREKAMDEAIADTRRPYNHRITKRKLDAAANESHECLNQYKQTLKEETYIPVKNSPI